MTYLAHLQAIVDSYRAAHPTATIDDPEHQFITAEGRLTDIGARDLHEKLCRRHRMTAPQIVEDWNRRCPADPW